MSAQEGSQAACIPFIIQNSNMSLRFSPVAFDMLQKQAFMQQTRLNIVNSQNMFLLEQNRKLEFQLRNQTQNSERKTAGKPVDFNAILSEKDQRIKWLEAELNQSNKNYTLADQHELEILDIRKQDAEKFQIEKSLMSENMQKLEIALSLQQALDKATDQAHIEKSSDQAAEIARLESILHNRETLVEKAEEILRERHSSLMEEKRINFEKEATVNMEIDTLKSTITSLNATIAQLMVEKDEALAVVEIIKEGNMQEMKEQGEVLEVHKRESKIKIDEILVKNLLLGAEVHKLNHELKFSKEQSNKENEVLEKMMQPIRQLISRKRRSPELVELIDLTLGEEEENASSPKKPRT